MLILTLVAQIAPGGAQFFFFKKKPSVHPWPAPALQRTSPSSLEFFGRELQRDLLVQRGFPHSGTITASTRLQNNIHDLDVTNQLRCSLIGHEKTQL